MIRFLYADTDKEAAIAVKKVSDSLNKGYPAAYVELNRKEFDAMLNSNRVIIINGGTK